MAFGSETGKKIVAEKLMFITPFKSFSVDELPPDPLSREVGRWMNKPGAKSVERRRTLSPRPSGR